MTLPEGGRPPRRAPGAAPRTLFDKIWDAHAVVPAGPDHPAVIYVDTHLVHEVTSPQAFTLLRERGLPVRRPDRTYAVTDHSVPTRFREGLPLWSGPETKAQVEALERNCEEFGIELFRLGDPEQGIVHVTAPELGLTRPGATVVCGDSHTSTHGAFGAWAFGIGTTEVAQVLATQCLLRERPRTLGIEVSGRLGPGVTAKDLILGIIRRLTASGGRGRVLEYRGETIRRLSMEERMTVCNMSIEAGARAGLIEPDRETLRYLEGRRYLPRGDAFRALAAEWLALAGDEGAACDETGSFDASALTPMVTWGTNPGMSCGIAEPVPPPGSAEERSALEYMEIEPGEPLLGRPVDVVFLGSCTNARITDLRAAAALLAGRRVHPRTRALVVPGSARVKEQAAAEGLDRIFLAAGAEWREPGCSLCIAMNGDRLEPGELAVSTSNRNFRGRQGTGGRTVLASPITAAASAVAGAVSDPRPLLSAS